MGCTTCGKSNKVSAQAVLKVIAPLSVNTDCDITIEQIDVWLAKVECAQKTGAYTQVPNITKKQLNIYKSFLLSAKNYADKPCQFENELQEIESFVTVLTALNLCNN